MGQEKLVHEDTFLVRLIKDVAQATGTGQCAEGPGGG
jgi:hypothetical protein